MCLCLSMVLDKISHKATSGTLPVEQKALEQINAVHKATAKENVCTSKTVGNDINGHL